MHKKKTQCCVLDEKGKSVHIEWIRTDALGIGHWFETIEAKTNDEI